MSRARPVIVAFAVLASLLVVTATPVAASHGLSAASAHTTCSDFDAGTLANMTTSGSGTECTVQLSSTAPSDGEVNHWPFDETSGSTAEDVAGDDNGTISGATLGVDGIDGTAFSFDGTDDDVDTDATMPAGSVSLVAWVNKSADTSTFQYISGVQNSANAGNRLIRFSDQGTNVVAVRATDDSASALIATSTSLSSGDWHLIVGVIDAQNDELRLYVNDTLVNTTDVSGSAFTTQLSNHKIAERPDSADSLNFDGDIDEPRIYNRALVLEDVQDIYEADQGQAADSGEYISENHTAEDTEQGWANLTTVTNATVTVTWETTDGTGWSTLNETTGITTAANHTFDWSVETNDTIRVNVTVENETGNGAPSFELADEGVLFTANRTGVDNGSASPTGDLATSTPTLEIDANDSDFDLVQGDSVTVTFVVDGSEVGTDTLTANGTASYTLTSTEALDGGSHTWGVNATDSYGHTTDSQTFDISTPGNLTVRNETPDHGIVSGTVTYKVFEQTTDSPVIANGTTDDGNISLDGLPVDSGLTIQLSADDYFNRTATIEDVFQQGDLFMLSRNETVNNVTFTIDDPTGQFTSSSAEIEIQRAINESIYAGSGGFSYMAVEGDEIGSAGDLRTTLERHERYRLVVRAGGETRVLGGYTVEEDTTEVLRPVPPDVNVTDEQGYAWNASVNNTLADRVDFEYFDPDDNTTDLRVVIYEQNNASNELYNQSHVGPHGFLRVTQLLTDEQSNETWVVEWSATREGESIGSSRAVGRQVIETVPGLADIWKHAAAVISTILIGAIFGQRNVEAGGIVVVLFAGGWWMVGWLPTEAGGAIMAALVIGIIWKSQAGRFG